MDTSIRYEVIKRSRSSLDCSDWKAWTKVDRRFFSLTEAQDFISSEIVREKQEAFATNRYTRDMEFEIEKVVTARETVDRFAFRA